MALGNDCNVCPTLRAGKTVEPALRERACCRFCKKIKEKKKSTPAAVPEKEEDGAGADSADEDDEEEAAVSRSEAVDGSEAVVVDEAPAEGRAYAALTAKLVVANARIMELEKRLTQCRATIRTQSETIRSYLKPPPPPPPPPAEPETEDGAAGAGSAAEDDEQRAAVEAVAGSEAVDGSEHMASARREIRELLIERMKKQAEEAECQAAEARRQASLEVGKAKQALLEKAINNQAAAESFRRTQLREERHLEAMAAAAVPQLPECEAAQSAEETATVPAVPAAVPAPATAPGPPALAPAVPAPASTTKGGKRRVEPAATTGPSAMPKRARPAARLATPPAAGPSKDNTPCAAPAATEANPHCGGCGLIVAWDRSKEDPRHKCTKCRHYVHSAPYICRLAGALDTSLIVDDGEFYCDKACMQ
jgi:hypothetical protein